VALSVGLHESTVSRATANKYVLLPTGRTIPFSDFFDGSLAANFWHACGATNGLEQSGWDRTSCPIPAVNAICRVLGFRRGFAVCRRMVLIFSSASSVRHHRHDTDIHFIDRIGSIPS
jgi:hypothetical protein